MAMFYVAMYFNYASILNTLLILPGHYLVNFIYNLFFSKIYC